MICPPLSKVTQNVEYVKEDGRDLFLRLGLVTIFLSTKEQAVSIAGIPRNTGIMAKCMNRPYQVLDT